MSRKQAQLQLEQDPLIAKKPNIRTQWKPPTTGYEENSQPSLTIPDQTLSVTEILARHTRGQDISQFIRAIQHGEDQDLPDLARMDISERYDYIEATRLEIKRLQQQAANEIREKRQKKADEYRKEQEKLQKLSKQVKEDTDPVKEPEKEA